MVVLLRISTAVFVVVLVTLAVARRRDGTECGTL
jgi:hypothetical protein